MKKLSEKKLIVTVSAVAAVLLIAAVIFDGLHSENSVEYTGYAMGSAVSVTLYGADDTRAAQDIVSSIEEEENSYISKYKESSEVYKLNKNGGAVLSSHTADIINKALGICKDSGGAFDITVGALSELWNFDNYTQNVPDEDDIADALLTCGFEQITNNGDTFTLGDSQKLDFGAVGKGIACDDALAVLQKSDIAGAVVSVGGTILTYGKNSDKEFWTVGIRSPEKGDSSVFMKLKINGTSFISTSGSYEKYFEKDGKIYHHILSTETGYPVENELKSVTVIADSGLVADGLSTACFSLGLDASLPILEKYNADAIFVDSENRVYITENYFDDDLYEVIDGYECYGYEGKYEEYTAVSAY